MWPTQDPTKSRMNDPQDDDAPQEPAIGQQDTPGGPYFGRLLIVLLLAVAFCGFMTWFLSTTMTD